MSDRWNDDRLDRLAALVEANEVQVSANSRDIAALGELIATNSRDIAALRTSTASNTTAIEQLAAIAHTQQQTLNAISSGFEILTQEIRGLRAENRRILTHLFGQNRED